MDHWQVGGGVVAVEVVGVEEFRCGANGGHHAFELPQPELHSQLHPGGRGRGAIEAGDGAAGMGHQGQQAFQQQQSETQGIAIAKAQLLGEAFQQFIGGGGSRGEPHKVLHRRQGAQLPPQVQAPLRIVGVARWWWHQEIGQPKAGLGRQVGLGAGGLGGVELIELIELIQSRQRQHQQALCSGIGVVLEEGGKADAVFFDQGAGLEAAGEDLAGVVEHPGLRFGLRAAEGGGGAHADQLFSRAAEAIAKASDQAGQIRALGPIEGVELIHHQVAEHTCGVVGPEPLHLGPE